MGWGGIDLVPMLPGKTRRQALDRAYADATFIVIRDGVPWIEPGPERDHTAVTKAQPIWMLALGSTVRDHPKSGPSSTTDEGFNAAR